MNAQAKDLIKNASALLSEAVDVKTFITHNEPDHYAVVGRMPNGDKVWKGGIMHWVYAPEQAKKYSYEEALHEIEAYLDGTALVGGQNGRLSNFTMEPVSEAIDARKFILRNRLPSDWTFKTERLEERGWDKYKTRIYFKGEEVALVHTQLRPHVKNWERMLTKANATLPFVEEENGFWDWLQNKHQVTLTWRGNTSLKESISPKDFIMHQVPTVEGVCKNFALEKVSDEYKDGALLWGREDDYSPTNSWVIRSQTFKGFLHLNRPVERHGQTLERLEVDVYYWEDRWGKHDARIEVNIGGRKKTLSSFKDEAALADRIERYLDRLTRTLLALRTTKSTTLERALAAAGFRVG